MSFSEFQVAKLERASLNDPVRIEVSSKYQTVDKLKQYYIFIPFKYKVIFLLLSKLADNRLTKQFDHRMLRRAHLSIYVRIHVVIGSLSCLYIK